MGGIILPGAGPIPDPNGGQPLPQMPVPIAVLSCRECGHQVPVGIDIAQQIGQQHSAVCPAPRWARIEAKLDRILEVLAMDPDMRAALQTVERVGTPPTERLRVLGEQADEPPVTG